MAKAVMQKNWYEIQAPDIFDEDVITETPAEKDSQVIGRRVKQSLTDLMDGTDKYYVDIYLKVTEVEGSKAFTVIDGMEVSNQFVSRMIRKRSDRMDLVHDTETKDGREVRVKFVGATLNSTSSKTLTQVRNRIKEIVDEAASDSDYNEFMESIFRDKLQKKVREAAQDIYPFRELEVRKTELLD